LEGLAGALHRLSNLENPACIEVSEEAVRLLQMWDLFRTFILGVETTTSDSRTVLGVQIDLSLV
jgi:hypothetical protein